MPHDIDQTLRDRFGLQAFRPGQREVIAQVLGGKDVLCVMPTGGGKSLCYQLPALLLEGVTLVVSPLIALMKDQVDALLARGLRATLLNSTLDPSEQKTRLDEIMAGRFDLVYVAPERFRSGRFVEAMSRLKPSLLAVDEAHCISEWGHDFRPDYARIGQARRAIGMPPCIALTATATDLVRRDVADQLGLRDPQQFVTGFDRPNLSYRVVETRKEPDKLAALAAALERSPGPAIVYASSRKRVEEVGRFLRSQMHRDAEIYHAGLDRDRRSAAQERFMGGDAEVVVATNAFGMGVDKANVRAVVHYNMPGTLEAYYQEAGRAGRDGLNAECTLLYAQGDRFLQEMFINNEYPPADMIYQVYEYLRTLDADPIELTQTEIKEAIRAEQPDSAVGTALRLLESAGALERFRPRENMAIVRVNAEPDEPRLADRVSPQAHIQRVVAIGVDGLVNRRFGEPVYFHPDEFAATLGLDRSALTRALKHLASEHPLDYVPPFRGNAVRINDRKVKAREVPIDFRSLAERKDQEYEKLERMIRYATSPTCRRAYILGYFGDVEHAGCGRCDRCEDAGGGPASVGRPIDTEAGREVLLKVLSGVARARGRFGKVAVAQMLVGSSAEKLRKMGLASLSTFGILASSGFNHPEVSEIIAALTAAGLVDAAEADRFRPVVNLTTAGWSYVKDATAAPLVLNLNPDLADKLRNGGLGRIAPASRPRPAAVEGTEETLTSAPIPDDDDGLADRLRALRTEWARAAKQPAYCVFSNQTLDSLVRERPTSPHALAAVKGLGPARVERYGAAILEAIAGASAADPSVGAIFDEDDGPRPPPPKLATPGRPAAMPVPAPSPSVAVAKPEPPTAGDYVSTEEWTWRLLDCGFHAAEAAAIRGLDLAAIIRHATWVARRGRPVPPMSFLDASTLDAWSAYRARSGDAPPPGVEPGGLWALFLACAKAPPAGA